MNQPLEICRKVLIKNDFEEKAIEETPLNFFEESGVLFKRKKDNLYCFVESKKKGGIIVTLFESNWVPFEKIENDYVDCTFCFHFIDRIDFENLIEHLN